MPGLIEIEFDYRNQRFQDALKGVQAFAGDIGKAAEPLTKVVRRELENFLATIGEALAQRHNTPWSPGQTLPAGAMSGKLAVRSGKLQKALRKSGKVTGSSLDGITGTITIPFPYGTHEFGATIRPRKAKYLAIPLPAALRSNGTPKKRSPRDWARTFVLKSRKGNLLIVQKPPRGRKGNLVFLYVLKKMVRIPPRLGLQVTVAAGIPFFVDRVIDRMVKNLLTNSTGGAP